MKTFVITVSSNFPAYHPKKFIETNFGHSLYYGIKKHTIRGNYDLWKRRIDKINQGEAILSVRQWMGKPYCSKQFELFQFTKIGIQKCDVSIIDDAGSAIIRMTIDNKPINDKVGSEVIKNDGLEIQDFIDWFKSPIKDGCIIHFTDLRY